MTRHTLLPFTLLFASAVSPLHALLLEQATVQSKRAVRSDGSVSSSTSTSKSSMPEEDAAYAAGSRALEQQRWPEAMAAFDKVINAKGKRADAALYWKAYTLNKLGKGPLALATCNQLRSQYASSPWNMDCSAVSIPLRTDFDMDVEVTVPPIPPIPPMPPMPEVHIEGRHGRDGAQRGSDDDLKLLALNSLLNQEPEKAIPILRTMLSGNQSMRVKKHALFVLAQSRSPEAQAVLHDAVLGKMDSELQREAIQSMAVFQGKRANDTLAEVYRSTSDASVRKSIISAFFISGDAPRMVELARNEKDLNVKRNIVSQLALMHDKAATDYMMELLK